MTTPAAAPTVQRPTQGPVQGPGRRIGLAAPWARGRTRRVARRIATLDPERQAREVVWLLGSREFPWDLETALSLALFRTYASPAISVVLAATGEFTERARKRYDDTELVMAWMVRDGLDGDRGREALRRMNAMHAAFDLETDDLHYVLTTFVCEPLRWIRRWGWRPLTAAETTAHLTWYLRLGAHMGLRDLPRDLAAHDAFNRRYEAERFRYHPANAQVATASVRMFLDASLPAALHPVGEVVIRAVLDRPLLAALGWEPAPAPVVAAVDGALRLRGHVQRTLLPERRHPYDHTTVPRPSWPDGHAVGDLGTFPDATVRARVAAARADLAGTPATGAHNGASGVASGDLPEDGAGDPARGPGDGPADGPSTPPA